jgi:hypothetical protein
MTTMFVVKRGLMVVTALLCFAGAAFLLYVGKYTFYYDYGGIVDDAAALRFLLNIDRSGGMLGMNASTYLEKREESIAESLICLGLAALLAGWGWNLLRRLRGKVAPERRSRWLRVATAFGLSLSGGVIGLLSFVFCAPWYVSYAFIGDDAARVAETGVWALGCLLGAALLAPKRWRCWLPLLAIALVVAAQAAVAGTSGMCLSLPRMLQGGHWVMRVE